MWATAASVKHGKNGIVMSSRSPIASGSFFRRTSVPALHEASATAGIMRKPTRQACVKQHAWLSTIRSRSCCRHDKAEIFWDNLTTCMGLANLGLQASTDAHISLPIRGRVVQDHAVFGEKSLPSQPATADEMTPSSRHITWNSEPQAHCG